MVHFLAVLELTTEAQRHREDWRNAQVSSHVCFARKVRHVERRPQIGCTGLSELCASVSLWLNCAFKDDSLRDKPEFQKIATAARACVSSHRSSATCSRSVALRRHGSLIFCFTSVLRATPLWPFSSLTWGKNGTKAHEGLGDRRGGGVAVRRPAVARLVAPTSAPNHARRASRRPTRVTLRVTPI